MLPCSLLLFLLGHIKALYVTLLSISAPLREHRSLDVTYFDGPPLYESKFIKKKPIHECEQVSSFPI
jgi:hypothetical protein